MTRAETKRLLIVVPLAVVLANLIGWLIDLNSVVTTLLVAVLVFALNAAADAVTQ